MLSLSKDNSVKQNMEDMGENYRRSKKANIQDLDMVCLMLFSNILQQIFLQIKMTN